MNNTIWTLLWRHKLKVGLRDLKGLNFFETAQVRIKVLTISFDFENNLFLGQKNNNTTKSRKSYKTKYQKESIGHLDHIEEKNSSLDLIFLTNIFWPCWQQSSSDLYVQVGNLSPRREQRQIKISLIPKQIDIVL